jgi:DNA-binding NarL/FixJ family response regulator
MSEFSKQLQVYLVEDSPIIQQLLVSTIEGAGAELVGRSSSAQQAINEIATLEPDLIVIDISLDFGNGFDVLRMLRDRHLAESARKVVLTHHANAEYRNLCFRLGASQFCDKSSDMWQVLALINTMAIGHRARPRGAPGAPDGGRQNHTPH